MLSCGAASSITSRFPDKETMTRIVDVHFPGLKKALLREALEVFFELREVPGLKKKPSTSELLDWLKLLLAEDILRRGAAQRRQEGCHPAALRRTAQERAGRAPVRAGGIHGARGPMTRPSSSRSRSSGGHATLEPLAREHASDLQRAAADGELWQLWYTSVPAPGATEAYVDAALRMREQLGAMPFVVRDNAAAEIVGCTRYFNVDAANRRLEIGHTWYARRVQRTAINTECKLLLLIHAFEQLRCIAVEFRTHWFNRASREAIARLGAKQDGVLRNHQIAADGSYRDTVVFSIIESEWPAVKRHLGFLLERQVAAVLIDFFLHLKAAQPTGLDPRISHAARRARAQRHCQQHRRVLLPGAHLPDQGRGALRSVQPGLRCLLSWCRRCVRRPRR